MARRPKVWTDEARANMSAAAKRAWENPERRAKASIRSREVLADPAVKARLVAGIQRGWAKPESRAKASASQKLAWDEDRRADQSRMSKERWSDPDFHAKTVAATRAAVAPPEVRAKVAAAKRPMAIEVPAWVARAGLTDDFLDHAEMHGEELAASHCRKLLRQAA